MSRYDYELSRHIAAQDYPFYALIMAAMRQADSHNEALLSEGFRETWLELQRRYNAPGGYLPGEQTEQEAREVAFEDAEHEREALNREERD